MTYSKRKGLKYMH